MKDEPSPTVQFHTADIMEWTNAEGAFTTFIAALGTIDKVLTLIPIIVNKHSLLSESV